MASNTYLGVPINKVFNGKLGVLNRLDVYSKRETATLILQSLKKNNPKVTYKLYKVPNKNRWGIYVIKD